MHYRSAATVTLLVIAACALGPGHAAPTDKTPIGPKWWPNKWGAVDQRGAANLLTPEKVLEAKSLITVGKIYQLGRVYEHGMPIPGKRHYSLTTPGLPTGAAPGSNQLVHNDELVCGEIGQLGTQFDGLGHVGVRVGSDDIFYNGNKLAEFGDTYGLKKLGVENVGPIFTRGILLDVAGVKKVRDLPVGTAISAADLQEALAVTKTKLCPGDAVLIRTGHGLLWMVDNAKFAEGEPGINLDAGRWLAEQQVTVVGCDNWALVVVPSENPDRPFEVHQHLLVRHGICVLENLDLEDLARDRVYEFAFVFSWLRLKGAPGSPGNPIVIK
jgi:kynurenine formamidase